jgi:hypothetical protein
MIMPDLCLAIMEFLNPLYGSNDQPQHADFNSRNRKYASDFNLVIIPLEVPIDGTQWGQDSFAALPLLANTSDCLNNVVSRSGGDMISCSTLSRRKLPDIQPRDLLELFMVRGSERVIFPQSGCRHERVDRPQPVRSRVQFEQ